MYCIHCGTKNLEGSNFCYRCGAATVPPPVPASPNPPGNYPTRATADSSEISYPYPPADYQYFDPPPSPNSSNIPSSSNYPYPLPPGPSNNGYSSPATSPASTPSINNYVPVPAFPASPSDLPVGLPHPLLFGAIGLPYTVITQPKDYYSYADPQGRVKLARRVGFWQRFAAAVIDTIVILIPLFIITTLYTTSLSRTELAAIARGDATPAIPTWLSLLVDVLALAYLYVLTLNGGQTLGKRALRIKVIRLDGQSPDWVTSALRQFLGYTLSSIPFLLGFIWAGWDAQKQAWHDKLARTLVVDTRILEEGHDFFLPRF